MPEDKKNNENNKEILDDEIFGEEIFSTEKAYGQEETLDDQGLVADIRGNDYQDKENIVNQVRQKILERRNINSLKPEISSDDIDASWQQANVDGEESSLGGQPTPDQDQIDEISRPWGLINKSDEELNTDQKRKIMNKKRQQAEEDGLKD